jgi:hypothetical protein
MGKSGASFNTDFRKERKGLCAVASNAATKAFSSVRARFLVSKVAVPHFYLVDRSDHVNDAGMSSRAETFEGSPGCKFIAKGSFFELQELVDDDIDADHFDGNGIISSFGRAPEIEQSAEWARQRSVNAGGPIKRIPGAYGARAGPVGARTLPGFWSSTRPRPVHCAVSLPPRIA